MKSLLFASLLVLPLGAYAASGPDATFYRHAAQRGISEVNLGNLALKKSDDLAVKGFAAQLVKEDMQANDKLRSVAASKNVKLPTKASMAEMATKTKLDVLSGSTFDKSFVKDMVKDQERQLATYRMEARSGHDADAKEFASATVPALKERLAKIRSIADKSGLTASR
jgi:putative membrane protein